MPYSSIDDLPQSVKDRVKSSKKRRQWLNVWNSSYDRHHDESRAFAEANAVVSKGVDAVSDFNFFLPISKVDKERRTVSGYASTPAIDLDGEIVSLDAVKKALPGYWQWRNIREMHTASAVGVAKEANVDSNGLWLTAKIVDDEAWNKCVQEVYKGFSIGGRKLNKVGDTITEIELVEISVVDRPANPECKFSVQKSFNGEAEAYLLKSPGSRWENKTLAIKKMAEAVEALAGDDFESAEPSFLNLSAGDGARAVEEKIKDSHDLDLGKGGTIKKNMNVATELSYIFDSLERMQNQLLIEGKLEGNDSGDVELANKLKIIRQSLADIIAQKAVHEKEEAANSTDENDLPFLQLSANRKGSKMSDLEKILNLLKAGSDMDEDDKEKKPMNMARKNVKKARKTMDDMEGCIKAAHAMHKAAYLAKQANGNLEKKDGEFDHQGAMEYLAKAYSDIGVVQNLLKAANMQLKKAASVEATPVGGSIKSPSMETGDAMFEAGGGVQKGAKDNNMISKTEADALVRAAKAEAEADLYKSLPASGKRPATFDLTKGFGTEIDSNDALWKGVNTAAIGSEDESAHFQAIGTHLGNRILNRQGKSILSPDFHGAAGAKVN